MKQTHTYAGKLAQMLVVLLPIFVTQLSLVSIGFFDTVMAGNVSEYDLAGVAVGVNLYFPIFGGIQGVISGLTPIIAQLYGAGKKDKLPFTVVQGVYLAAAIGLSLIFVASFAVGPVLRSMQLEAEVERIATGFLTAMAFGFCAILIAQVLRNFIDALGYTRITMLITVLAVPVNIGLNYLFIFGKFGFPALGGVGAGVGSALTYWLILLLNLLVVTRVKPFRGYRVFARFYPVSLKKWKEELSVGVPIGGAIFCEQSIFGAVGLFMAAYGTGVIAAHQAALNFSTMVYMIPLSISMALTILVGYETGAKRYADAKKYCLMGIFTSILFSSILAFSLIHLKEEIARLYTNDAAVFHLIQTFLIYAICLQLSDAVSAPLQGSLRGYKDVKVTLLLAVASYWVIGLPVGYALAKFADAGPYGFWLGLILGIAVGAVFLLIRLRAVQKRQDAILDAK